MDRVGEYFKTYANHRAALRAAWSAYNDGMETIKAYKGSAGYDDRAKELAATRDAAVAAARATAAKDFDGILAGMRCSLDFMPMPVVTDEQMNALAVLKMRDKVTRGELEQAARAVADNPVALGVVYEVAEKNNYHNLRGVVGGESIDSTRRCIESLASSARALCALDKVDAMRERAERAMRSVHETGTGVNELRGNHVDRDLDNPQAAARFFGGVGDVSSFSEFVNREL